MEEKKEYRRVEDSRTEQCYIIMYDHLNGAGSLFGGQLLSWLDMTAGIVGLRHSNHNVVTVAIDNISFEKSAKLTDVVSLIGEVTYVGRTSMEVHVESFKENRDGEKIRINEAYFVMVAVDDETGRPIEVPGLILDTPEKKEKWNAGEQRNKLRQLRKQMEL